MGPCPELSRKKLDDFYRRYNRRRFVHPDPLEFLYRYGSASDREAAGLIASGLAYGRVAQILKSVGFILDILEEPALSVRESSDSEFRKLFKGFRHRFTTGEELLLLLSNMRWALREYGSLNECFLSGYKGSDPTVLPALEKFVLQLSRKGRTPSLLPDPGKKSACKRLNLYLRWMVRRDEVDPGGWQGVSKAKLVVPLDTHMHRVAKALRLTERDQAGMKTAVEITESFRRINPEDPVKYDFALTRPGIMNDSELKSCLRTHFQTEVYD